MIILMENSFFLCAVAEFAFVKVPSGIEIVQWLPFEMLSRVQPGEKSE